MLQGARGFVLAGIVVAVSAGAVLATAGQTTWSFQRVDSNLLPSYPDTGVALGMRTGATWPTVFYQVPSGNQVVASALTPAGWLGRSIGGTPSAGSVQMRAEANGAGQVGAVWQLQTTMGFVQSSRSGWQTSVPGTIQSPSGSGINAPDLAYLSNNQPLVAYADQGQVYVAAYDGLAWNRDAVSVAGGSSSKTWATVAVDSQDHVGVAYVSDGMTRFATKDIASGQWYGAEIAPFISPIPNSRLSLAFGRNDVVGLAMLTNQGIGFSAFDIPSGTWSTDLVTGGAMSMSELAFNSLGHPALAYVRPGTGGPEVHFAINDGSGWADTILPGGIDAGSGLDVSPYDNDVSVALAFDADDLPVVSFFSRQGLVLAYDPIVTPEPATLLLMLAGWGLIRRRMS